MKWGLKFKQSLEVHQKMFHVKYLTSSLYGLGEDFLRFFFQLHGNHSSAWNLNQIFEQFWKSHTKFYQIWPSGLEEVISMKNVKTSRYNNSSLCAQLI